MALIVGAPATSYDLPQYLGELMQKGEKPNSVLRLIGGLTAGIILVTTTTYAMGQDYTLPAADAAGKLEGQVAVLKEQDTNQSTNVLQIFQEGYGLTYSRLGATGNISGLAAVPGAGNGTLFQPGSIEEQRNFAIQRVQRNVNVAFLRGSYQNPANNATARQTRGIRTGLVTNVFANGGTARPLTKVLFENALRDSMANGMFAIGATVVALCDATQYDKLIGLYETAPALAPGGELAGVAIRRIATKWGYVEVVFEPDMNAGEIVLFQPTVCSIKGMVIPGKGVFFSEPKQDGGAVEKEHVYGELGIDYRHEALHARIGDLATA